MANAVRLARLVDRATPEEIKVTVFDSSELVLDERGEIIPKGIKVSVEHEGDEYVIYHTGFKSQPDSIAKSVLTSKITDAYKKLKNEE